MIELKEFSGSDLFAFQGAMNFPDERKPLIAKGENVILICSGFQDCDNGFGISLIFDEDKKDFLEAFKYYKDVDRAISDAKIFAQMLNCDLTKEFLSDFGFEVI